VAVQAGAISSELVQYAICTTTVDMQQERIQSDLLSVNVSILQAALLTPTIEVIHLFQPPLPTILISRVAMPSSRHPICLSWHTDTAAAMGKLTSLPSPW
jgi:hypothetical protein